ncbi:MAG: hypothetical protein WBP03_02895 [Candidatus Saccharimonadales bacterium]
MAETNTFAQLCSEVFGKSYGHDEEMRLKQLVAEYGVAFRSIATYGEVRGGIRHMMRALTGGLVRLEDDDRTAVVSSMRALQATNG